MKKLIMSIFALCLFINACVFAETTQKQTEAISLMNDLGIYDLVDEDNAQTVVTRGEFAKMIVRLMGKTDFLSTTPKRIFADVPADSDMAASVEYLYENGVMGGYGEAQFKPENEVGTDEFVKTVVSVMGYETVARQNGGYPSGYYKIAAQNKILSGMEAVNGKLTYADMAVVFKNVLESKKYLIIDNTSGGEINYTDENDEEYMTRMLGIYRVFGMVEAYDQTSIVSTTDSYGAEKVKIGGSLFDTVKDMSEYIGMNVRAYYTPDDEGFHLLHIMVDQNVKTVDVDSKDINKSTTLSRFVYYENNREKTLNIDKEAIFIYNGKRLDVVSDADLVTKNGSVRLISNSGSGKYDVVIIEEFQTFVVDKVLMTDGIVNMKYGKGSLDLSGDGDLKPTFILDGAEVDISNVSSGCVLSVAISKNLIGDVLAKVIISNNQITETAVNLRDKDGTRVVALSDGTEYEYTDDYQTRLQDGQSETYEPAMGAQGTFYIDVFGRVAAYKASTKEYAYIVKCYYDENTEDGGIRLFTKDGKMETYLLPEKLVFDGQSVERAQVPNRLLETSPDNTVNQLIVYKVSEDGYIRNIKTAQNKMSDEYYIASEDEFVLNAHPKNNDGVPCGVRFYKNMAVDRPYSFVDGQTIQFMVPTDKKKESAYRIATKPSTTDVTLPAPLYLYDAGKAGALGAIVSNTSNDGKFTTPVIVDSIGQAIDEDNEVCTQIVFVGGQSVFVGDDVTYSQPKTNWSTRVDYSNITVKDLKRGDVIQYTTINNKVDMLKVVVKSDDIGPIRIDGDNIQLSGNMVADVISVSDNGRTALVKYFNRDGKEINQTMLINSTTYRYESKEDKVYNSSAADLRAGDRVLINSYWWSPKLVVIFR